MDVLRYMYHHYCCRSCIVTNEATIHHSVLMLPSSQIYLGLSEAQSTNLLVALHPLLSYYLQ